ncbi:MAG: ABC transporter [Rickettsiaceae bacterium]|nr:ABC transporter [Rickettsiaceae bacterium]
MDEAERCHAIIYIADGKIMTCGTVDDVIQKAGLTVWVVNGKSLVTLYKALENHPAISNIAPFGESLHISGTNPDTLSAAINPYKNNPSYHWQLVDTSMEDAFIHYMANAEKENRL